MPALPFHRHRIRPRVASLSRALLPAALFFLLPLLPSNRAHASLFEGETLDAVAEAMSWVVIVVVPMVAIAVFWILHIMPEKIAEKRKHPQAKAIICLCLLSLFFGGLLWPIAWLQEGVRTKYLQNCGRCLGNVCKEVGTTHHAKAPWRNW